MSKHCLRSLGMYRRFDLPQPSTRLCSQDRLQKFCGVMTVIGIVGKLHPRLAKDYDVKRAAYVFELDAAKALASGAPSAEPVSKFPAIRRDIAVIVDDHVSANELVDAVAEASPGLIRDVRIFDIYTGEGIEAGRKSVAIGLILQETSRTLTDDDADTAMAAAITKLEDKFAAELRD